MDDSQRLLAIVKLNNRGAFQIETRQYGNAVLTLTEAIFLSKQVVAQYRVEGCSQDAQSTQSSEECYFSQCMQCPYRYADKASPPPLISHKSASFRDQPSTENDEEGEISEFVYRHPIRIPRQAIKHSFQFNIATSIMVIFNLALAHQLYATEDETLSSHLFEKSAKLYECAFSLLLQQDFESNVLFLLATVNNLGQAHRSLDQSGETATKCFQHVLSILMFLVDSDEGEKTPSFEGFLRSTSHLVLQEDCYAAAA
jgi:hypothetical protein